MTDAMTAPTGPLKGIRVLDLTAVVLGPFATQTLGDWGADVIKVEPLIGDTARNSGVFRNRGMASVFLQINRNKRSIALDLKSDDGKDVLRRLIPTMDVLISNIRPAGMTRLGFGYDTCKAMNPRLVYAVATGFGQDGPWRARPAFDEIIQASSGFASAMGDGLGSGDQPQFMPSLVADKLTGMAMVQAVCAALFHRERSGEGQMIEVPMLETLSAFNSVDMMGGMAFEPPIGPPGYKRMRERKPAQTKDGWITMTPYSSANWCQFFEAVGRPELIEQLEINDPVKRMQNIDVVYATMREIALTRTSAEWEELLLSIDVPHASFTRMTDVTAHEHLKAVGMFPVTDHPTEGAVRDARPPTKFAGTPANVRRPVPRLGQHTVEILGEAGFSEAEIQAMRDRKSIRIA